MAATATAGPATANLERTSRAGRAGRAMGSPLRLQLAGEPPPALVDRAWSAVVDEFEATEQALSRFRPSSEVHQLRLARGWSETPSRRLVAALTVADRARRLTGGRFDPRVLVDLERLGSVPVAPPAGEAPRAAQAHAGVSSAPLLRRVGRDGPIEVPLPVDFGGIGKGLALRWAARRLESLPGSSGFLLEAGGDLVARGAPLGEPGWRIAIEDPRSVDHTNAGSPSVVVELPLPAAAIATSSTRRARWLDPSGREVHHLIDPRTGEPGGTGLLAVTVLGPDPAWAEVWSKALFLEGAAGIAALARRRGLAAWWVTTAGDVEMTPAARWHTIWVAGEH